MCQSKAEGGQRCAAHTAAAMARAQENLIKAAENGDLEAIRSARDDLKSSFIEYASTPEGQRYWTLRAERATDEAERQKCTGYLQAGQRRMATRARDWQLRKAALRTNIKLRAASSDSDLPAPAVGMQLIHGSHLYGLAHAESDLDIFVVYLGRPEATRRSRWAKQTIVGDEDQTSCDLSTLARYAADGVPQYVEAMCAPPSAFLTDKLEAYRAGFHVAPWMARRRYIPAIAGFIDLSGDGASLTPKKIRHGIRLAHNFAQIESTGRCQPTLTTEQVEEFTSLANGPREAYMRFIKKRLWN